MNPPQQYSFGKLRVWHKYLATANFPRREIYGLTSQCNRARVSAIERPSSQSANTIGLTSLVNDSTPQLFFNASTSASTISRTNCSKLPLGFQPSVFRILSTQPTKRAGSIGRSNAESCLTYSCQGRSTTLNAASTNSRTECVWPVATT